MADPRVVLAPASHERDERRAVVERARQRGFTLFALREEDGFERGPGEEPIAWDGKVLTLTAADGRRTRAPVARVSTPADLEAALAGVPEGGLVLIRWAHDRIIPLENAVARRGRSFLLWVVTDSVADIPAALGALEHGADRVLVEVDSASTIEAIETHLDIAHPPPAPWELVPVHRLVAVGMGDRVIVDTTSLLKPSEGLLVGSAAAFMLHVASEAVGSTFTRPRPFRVNAGAAHSYTLMADGSTRYLSELRPGDALLVVDPSGSFRSARVGRIKTERRPLKMVEILRGERPFTVFLQDAETVRLSSDTGRLSTPELKKGARVYGMALPAARHLGTAIEETIDEF